MISYPVGFVEQVGKADAPAVLDVRDDLIDRGQGPPRGAEEEGSALPGR